MYSIYMVLSMAVESVVTFERGGFRESCDISIRLDGMSPSKYFQLQTIPLYMYDKQSIHVIRK